jgi:hypothetical protein
LSYISKNFSPEYSFLSALTTNFIVIVIEKIFHTVYVGIFMIYNRSITHVPSSNYASISAKKQTLHRLQAYLDISCHLNVPNCIKIALTTLYLHILRASTTMFLPAAGISIPDCGKSVRSSKAEIGETHRTL